MSLKGKIYKEGMGMNFLALPREQYVIIPTSVNRITFATDQITLENQGVEISGFAIWRIDKPNQSYRHFNFQDAPKAIETINHFLKDVVDSAIRHKVSNMGIEDVLRKRGSIILELKKELEYMANLWGLNIETIEIREVRIMSNKLFHNMQAKYRNQIRLESEKSTLDVEEAIIKNKSEQKKRIEIIEEAEKKRALQRETDFELMNIANQEKIQKFKIENDIKLQALKEEKQQRLNELSTETLKSDKALLEAQMQVATLKNEHQNALAKANLATKKEQYEVENLQNAHLLLYQNLPEIAKHLNLKEVNITGNNLERLIKVGTEALSSKN